MQRQKVLIDGESLKHSLETFADFGRTDKNGVSRLSLSAEDISARNHFLKCCRDLGMTIKIDDMGTVYATLEGEQDKPPIVIGSHLDSVIKGGRFDGSLGVIAGLEIIKTLVKHNIKPSIPIMIVNFTNEEGARFEPSMMASGVLSGRFSKTEMFQKKDVNGVTFAEAIHDSGYKGHVENRLKEASTFLELHIEQGPILESESLSIGIVECVLGMVCYEIEVTGESDHAGTTPMNMRKDALFTANDLISEIRQKVGILDDELVFTIGRVNVSPNIHTVIPNKVIFSFEARHKDPNVIQRVEEIIQGLPSSSMIKGCEVHTTKLWDRHTVLFDQGVCNALEESTKLLGYPYKRMVSGAGHDAQFIASYIPSAMIFVPSLNGKSHCEEELTVYEDCTKGANVLLETVLTILSKY